MTAIILFLIALFGVAVFLFIKVWHTKGSSLTMKCVYTFLILGIWVVVSVFVYAFGYGLIYGPKP